MKNKTRRKSKRIKGGNLLELQPYLIEGVNASLLNVSHLCKNPSPVAVDYILKQIQERQLILSPTIKRIMAENTQSNMVQFILNDPLNIHEWRELSSNSNDAVVEFLLEHSHLIQPTFYSNSNDMATQYCLERIETTDDRFRYFCLNENELAVDYILNRITTPRGKGLLSLNSLERHNLYQNSNPRMVHYILDRIQTIKRHLVEEFWIHFAKNPNPDAVACIFENINNIYTSPKTAVNRLMFLQNLCANTNIDVVEYMIRNYGNSNYIDWNQLSANPSIFQNTDYILK